MNISDEKPDIEQDQEIVEATTTEVVDTAIIDRFDALFAYCDVHHLQRCNCQIDDIDALYTKYMEEEFDDLEEKGEADNNAIVADRMDYARRKAVREVAFECKKLQTRCPLERAEITQNILMFNKKFELDDSRVYMIVKSVLSHQLSVFRMQMESNYHGVIQVNSDKFGNNYLVLNPVEEEKRKFDESIVKAIDTLNRIIFGDKSTKVQFNVDLTGAIIDAYAENITPD